MSFRDAVGTILDLHGILDAFILKAVGGLPVSGMTEQPGTVVNHSACTLSHLNA